MDIRELVWERASQHLFVPKEQYMAALESWDVEPVMQDGELLLVVMRKGDELHFLTVGSRPIRREVVRAVLAPQLAAYGRVTTRTPKVETRQHRFNRVVGFRQVGEDQYDILYEMTPETCRA